DKRRISVSVKENDFPATPSDRVFVRGHFYFLVLHSTGTRSVFRTGPAVFSYADRDHTCGRGSQVVKLRGARRPHSPGGISRPWLRPGTPAHCRFRARSRRRATSHPGNDGTNVLRAAPKQVQHGSPNTHRPTVTGNRPASGRQLRSQFAVHRSTCSR